MFKVGDKVRMKEDCSGNKAGQVYEVHNGTTFGMFKKILYVWNETTITIAGGCSCKDNWELVEEVATAYKNPTISTEIG